MICHQVSAVPSSQSQPQSQPQSQNPLWQALAEQIKEDPNQVINEAQQLIEEFKRQQKSTDELHAMAILTSALVATSQFEAAEKILAEALIRLEDEGNQQLRMLFLREQIILLHERGEWQQVIEMSTTALVIARSERNPEMIAHFLHNRSRGWRASSQNERALIDMLEAYQLAKKNNMPLVLAEIVNGIALVHQNIGQYDEAIRYFKEALSLIDAEEDKFGASILLYNIGTLYVNKRDSATAKSYLEQSLLLSLALKDKIGVAYVHSQLASLAYDSEDYQTALKHVQRSMPVFEQAELKQPATLGKLNLAKIKLALGEHQTALAMLLAIASDIKQLNNDLHTKTHLLSLARSYLHNQEISQAFDYFEKAISHIERTASKNNQESLQRVQTQMNILHEQQKTALLQKENELQKQRLAQQDLRQQLVYATATIAVIIVLVILIVLYQQVRSRRKFTNLALTDELTGAPNRRSIREHGKSLIEQAKNASTDLAAAVIDLDNFKVINDNFGHEAGDNVLKAFYRACEKCIRASDKIGRIGGEEWLLLMPAATEQHIREAFQRIRAELTSQHIVGLPENYMVTFSMGATSLQGTDSHLDDMIRRADSAVYQAKDQGRDQWTISAV